jgi:hypothetical protein
LGHDVVTEFDGIVPDDLGDGHLVGGTFLKQVEDGFQRVHEAFALSEIPHVFFEGL